MWCQKVSFLRLIDIPPDRIIARRGSVPRAVLASGRGRERETPFTRFIHYKRLPSPTCQFHGKLKECPPSRRSGSKEVGRVSLVLVSSTHSVAPGLIYAPNFTARIKAMGNPLIGSVRVRPRVRLSTLGVHQVLLPLVARPPHRRCQNVTSNEKVAQLRQRRKLPFISLSLSPASSDSFLSFLPWNG